MNKLLFALMIIPFCLVVSCIKSTPFDGMFSGGSFNSHDLTPPPAGTVTLGAELNAFPRQMILTSDNQIVIGAFLIDTAVDNRYRNFAKLIKTDLAGNIVWVKNVDPSYSSYMRSLCQDSNGDLIIAFGGMGYGSWGACLTKTDANGNIKWQKIINDTTVFCAAGDKNGFVVAGRTVIKDGTVYPSWIMGFDSNGDTLFSKQPLDSSTYNELGQVALFDGCIIAATFKTTDDRKGSYMVYKFDRQGNHEWTKEIISYRSEGNNVINPITLSNQETFLVPVELTEVTKLDFQGNIISKFEKYGLLYANQAGGFWCVSGWGENGQADASISLNDDAGATLWKKKYGGANNENGMAMVRLANGSMIIAADTKSYTNAANTFNDLWIFKVDSTGNQIPLQ